MTKRKTKLEFSVSRNDVMASRRLLYKVGLPSASHGGVIVFELNGVTRRVVSYKETKEVLVKAGYDVVR